MLFFLVLSLFFVSFQCAPLTEDAFAVPGVTPPNETPQEKFVRVDRNGDHELNFDEFLHSDWVYEEAKKEEFNIIDLDRNGKISRPEYDEHYRQQNTRSDNLRAKYFSEIFQQFDANGDKFLTEDEIRTLLNTRFLVQPRQNFGQIVYGFDTDHSGGLDLYEYMKLDEKFPFDQTDPLSSPVLPNALPKKTEKVAALNDLKL